ncbi:hypothetical protein [Bradyrhizobium sp. CCBAU 51765]|uniref:hypothetical protein n=1 Tax=Bradyrhizobium sp. CCBAU 51765 TaxID=1325102 RepID=UPI0018892B02|nr:hypothetical protein [Bradyrhizobium sp. CCBAU 51765]QOZ11203.1 hypothetical protein XH96_29485 [Bradyrhizobium sp. CCBAU 51765]
MPAVSFALSRAHSMNIERYHRLLKTHLTDVERDYIEWRLSQEQAALAAIDRPHQNGAHADAGRAASVY